MKAKEFLKKHGFKQGQLIEVQVKGEILSGFVLPSNEENLKLKLESGYNVGVKPSHIKNAKKLNETKKARKALLPEIKENPSLPTIAILHTGGTIASRVDYGTGGVYAAFNAKDLIEMFPEITKIANFEAKLVSEIMSEDIRFKHMEKLAGAIEKEIRNGVKGIIIGHGTDFLHFTAAALAFMFENLPIPVLLVGSQRSSDRGSSDAAMNLICAARFIAETDFCGVGICMHEGTGDESCVVLPATKTRKMHSTRRDAFKAINAKPIAKIPYPHGKIEFLEKSFAHKPKEKMIVLKKLEEKVGLIKTHPNMFPEDFLYFMDKKFKGLILEGSGLGHAPINVKEGKEEIVKAIEKVVESECVVVSTSQTIYGRVQLNVYTNLRKLKDAGVISGEDMLPETAFIKLAWLLGNFKKKEIAGLVGKNLRGEISPCTGLDSFKPGK